MNYKEALAYGGSYLKDHGIASFSLDAQVILMYVKNISRTELLVHQEEGVVTMDEEIQYKELIQKRGENMPVAYITGHCEFMSLPFYVSEDVLIPRPDTEILAEEAIRFIQQTGAKQVLDLGTGSGCLAVSIAKYTGAAVTAVDISPKAIQVAKGNAKLNGVDHLVQLFESNLFDELPQNVYYDLVISNPPYIESGVIPSLMEDVKDYEPMLALDGGATGLLYYEKIVPETRKRLREKGGLMLEIGCDQANAVKQLMQPHFEDIYVVKDLAGLDRVIVGK